MLRGTDASLPIATSPEQIEDIRTVDVTFKRTQIIPYSGDDLRIFNVQLQRRGRYKIFCIAHIHPQVTVGWILGRAG